MKVMVINSLYYPNIIGGAEKSTQVIVENLKKFDIEPANHTDAAVMNKISNNRMRKIISEGGTGASFMPGWKGMLTEDEINAVISYIRLIAAN